jgi:copper chaperone CopZ
METIKFKTNINCGGCVKAVTPFLNTALGISNWQVDVTTPERILTVTAEGINAEAVKQAVERAGFKAEELG